MFVGGGTRLIGSGLLLALLWFGAGPLRAETAAPAEPGLSLAECLEMALHTNPALAISTQNQLAAREKIGEARGGYYPTFKATSSYTYTTPAEERMGAAADSYDTRLAIRQPLYDGGATSSLIAGVRQTVVAQEYEVLRTRQEIALAVKSAFYDLQRRRDLLAVAEESRASAERHLEQARALYGEGLSPRADVLKVEVQVSNAGLEVIRAENGLLQARANLVAAMGLPAGPELAVRPAGALPSPPSLPPLAGLLARAAAERPELRAMAARIEAARSAVRQAESGFYPSLSLDAALGQQESSYPPEDKKWSLGVTLAIPVFERLTARSKKNQALAALAALQASELQTLRGVELEVQQAWLALKEARERLGVSGKAREQAEEDLRVSEGRYREGVGNILELLDAQTALVQAKTNQVVATYDIASSGARLDRAAGVWNDI